MKKIFYIVTVILVSAVCMSNTACGGGGGTYTEAEAVSDDAYSYDMATVEPVAATGQEVPLPAAEAESVAGAEPDAPFAIVKDPKKIIKTGRMNIDVGDMASAKAGVDGLVAAMGGYYLSEAMGEYDRTTTCNLSIRIPATGYEEFIAAVEGAGYGSVSSKTIDARDVTEEFIDIETRLANKRDYLERYRELLRKAVSIKDIMDIQEQVRVLEEEIESAEGRLRYLGDQVSYSTLDLTLVQQKDYKYTPPKGDNFPERTKRALSGGWNILKYIVLTIIRLWPIWIIGGGVLVLVRYIRRKRRNRRR